MRILVISNYYPPFEIGGWGQLIYDVSERLAERGHSIFVITSNHRVGQLSQPECNVTRVLNLESQDLAYYHPYYTFVRFWRERQNQRYLSQVITEFEPEVIFINGMWNLPASVARYVEQLCPDRVVYYIASTWPTDIDAHTAYWTKLAIRPWLNPLKKFVYQLVRRTLLSNHPRYQLAFKHVLCVSAFIQRYLIDEAGVSLDHTYVVHNGIDLTEFTMKNKMHEPGSSLQLLYAGGFWEIKGVHTAVEAMGHLVYDLGVTNVHLTLIGAGHPSYEKSLRDRINNLKLEKFVSFGKRVPRSQMPDLLKKYDILLFPSIGPEALARMTQEAMASGLVVIGTTKGGTPEILHDGKNGLTFEAGNAVMLADKIAHVANDPQLCAKLALAARQTVEERFTIGRMVDEIEEHLRRSISNSEGPGGLGETTPMPKGIGNKRSLADY